MTVSGLLNRIRSALPEGRPLPDDVWERRHRGILALLWLHAVGIVCFAVIRGYSLPQSLFEGSLVAAAALLATSKRGNRKFRAAMASLGLITSSAVLVHLSGGYIEFHFHFFVMIAVMALYQDWTPFLLAIAYVVVHHGTVGVFAPTAVYNHPDAFAHPWKWAAIHGVFVTAASIASLIAWRLSEQARAQTELIMQSAGEGIFGLDLQGKATFVNPAAARMIGWEVRELIGQPLHDILHHAKPDGTPYPQGASPIYAAFRDGAVHHEADEVFWRKDSTSFPVEYTSTPIRERGELLGAVVTFQDISERKRGEEEIRSLNTSLEQRVLERTAQLTEREDDLRKAKTFLEQLIAASPGMIFLGNVSDLSFHYVSPNIERILGYAPESVLGIPGFWLERIHPDHRERFLAERQRVLDEKLDRVEYEVPFRHKNGTYRWLSSAVLYKYDDRGKPTGALGYNVDVTERKAAEENIKQAKEEAERASLAKSEFLSRMSHELRTPLNAILGFAQLLEMDNPAGEARESVEQILKGGNHLLQLINEVLDIARIEAGRLAISPEPVSVDAVVQESLDLIAPLAAQRHVQLSGEPARTHDVYVQADRQRLKQVLLNLLSNAVKYNRKEGTVVLSCQEISDGRLRISVSDTGTGIPPEMLERLFVPFERLGVEKAGVDGTGIGLALSKGLVELMGGDIGVESQVGQGSTFWVELAVAEDQAGRYERMREEIPAPGRVYAGDHPRTVLYIEDNLSNLELLQRLLLRWPVKLLSAMQGRLGLELARQYRPDLILVDLHLPDITGDEILRRLRETPQTSRIPVVVISADPTQGQADRLIAIGAQAYLTKPLDVKKLMGILNETLKEGAAT